MEEEFWCLVFDNYHDTDHIEYFDTREHAVTAFEEICEVCKNHEEFEKGDDMTCCWFDPAWNEYSTFVYLAKLTMPAVNHSPTSMFFERDYEKEEYTG